MSCPHQADATLSRTTLIEPAELDILIGQDSVIVVDCRFTLSDPDAGRIAYESGHVPGARYAHLDDDLSGPVVAGETGRHPLPASEAFAATVSKWGISNASQVVCYDDSHGAIAARLWWMMNWLGHRNVAVMNGGWTAWTTEGFAVNKEVPKPIPSKFQVSLDTSVVLTTAEIEEGLNDARFTLIDARDHERYSGRSEPIDPVAGHIPGAISLPFRQNVASSGRFLDKNDLRDRYSEIGLTRDSLWARPIDAVDQKESVVCYCGSGVTAAHHVLAMRHAGLDMAKLYAGSWSEWILDPSRPIETLES